VDGPKYLPADAVDARRQGLSKGEFEMRFDWRDSRKEE
jgi:hypothetical protein